jgi:2-dehydropantoate 2-reductase
MRHPILRAGAVGGLLGAALARSGAEVVLLLRPKSLARYRGVIAVDSVVLGRLEAKIAGITVLDRDVDVVWITPKATDLQVALPFSPAAAVKAARTSDSP